MSMSPLLSRRTFMNCGCLGALGMSLGKTVRASGKASSLSPDAALDMLKKGNQLFVADKASTPVMDRRKRLALAEGQAPFATVLCCADSRVPPELLFSRGLGEIFTVRNAGNLIDSAAMGSIEYGVGVLGSPLLVVLGHEKCGAVQAAVDVVGSNKEYPGSIGPMIAAIVPDVLRVRTLPGDLLDNAVREHVASTVRRLKTGSEPLLSKPLTEGRLKIVGARYDLQDGEVEFFR